MNLIVTTNQKSVTNTQKNRKEYNITLKKVIKSQRKRTKEKTKELQKQQEHKKAINTYLSIITLNNY